MERLELCRLLDCRLFQHQHMDDFFLNDCGWLVVVASVDLRLDRLHYHRYFCGHERPFRCHVSHWFPRCQQIIFWYLGQLVARLQPCCHGSVPTLGFLLQQDANVFSACVWYGVQSYIGGHCVYLMIRSIWKSWDRDTIPNSFSKDSGTTTADFVSFFLFWFLSLPAIWFPVHKIRHLFTVKAYIVPCAGIAFLAWTVSRAGGIGPIIKKKNTIHGSDLGWEIVKGIMSSIANFATLIVNGSDFSRFARKPSDALWSQMITIPFGFALTSFIGIIVSSSSTVIYNEAIWDPLDLLENFINDGGSAQRFGVFVIAMAFALAQLGTNIAANSVSAGTDMTALFPRYINIRRGGYICAAIGLAMCPYNLLTDANQFTTYLSAYSVFLSSIAGVMVSDYYLVRKGYLEIKELYDGRKSGPYFYTWGINWRAYAAYISGILINVVGFAGAIGRDVPIGAQYIYNLNYFFGFGIACGMYWTLCRFFPVPATSDRWMEVGDEIDDVRVAYNADSPTYDEEHVTGNSKGVDGMPKQF